MLLCVYILMAQNNSILPCLRAGKIHEKTKNKCMKKIQDFLADRRKRIVFEGVFVGERTSLQSSRTF